MRDIRFRAWDKQLGVMSGPWKFGQVIAPIDGFELMQFTGLKDCNGMDIFEGDILDFDSVGKWGSKLVPEVVPEMSKMLGEWPLRGSKSDVSDWRRVIGNIHENPELLRGGE